VKKITLMKKFMQNFVGKGLHLVIREDDGAFRVHTIEIMQKTDQTCPVKDIPVGDYFFHLKAVNQAGNEASIACDWSEDLLQNLMDSYREAKDAEASQIIMFRDPLSAEPNKWLLSWGSDKIVKGKPKKEPIRYIS
jgi:hypothetical protein